MGSRATGALIYGYAWRDDPDAEWSLPRFDDWKEELLKRRGERNPWVDLQDSGRPDVRRQWADEHRVEIDAWRVKVEAVWQEFGVEVGYSGSGYMPIPYVYVLGSESKWDWEKPLAVDLAVILLRCRSDWNEKLARFLAAVDVQRPHPEPCWWLVAYYG